MADLQDTSEQPITLFLSKNDGTTTNTRHAKPDEEIKSCKDPEN
jgi:hypothetical protein